MTNPAQIAATSIHDLAHAKGVPTAAREAMLLMQERIAHQEAVIAGLVDALEEISNLHGEINPSNYDHDDACELNRQFCYGITVAAAALAKAKESRDV